MGWIVLCHCAGADGGGVDGAGAAAAIALVQQVNAIATMVVRIMTFTPVVILPECHSLP